MELVCSLPEMAKAATTLMDYFGNQRVVAVEGEMGAGKTTLIHFICRSAGVKGTMGSPSFSIINEYLSATGIIYHIDLYRCRSQDEAIRAGVEECLYSGQLCFVEWPSRAPGMFPEDTIRLSIMQIQEAKRKIIVHCKK